MEDPNVPQRERYWSELSADQKIERLHDVVRSLRHKVNTQAQIIHDLAGHQHGVDGRILVNFGMRDSITMHEGDSKYF